MKLEPMIEKIFQGAMTRSAEGEFLSENRGRRKRMAEHYIPHYRTCRAIQKLPVAIRKLVVIALVEARQEDRERTERAERRSYYKSTKGNNYKSGHH